ncbi:MAG: enoyl-CoA hydratase/isomerase family protein [Candidatus Obscuribacterales bacterium]|nr:enoyl-CoA hydratase/isomerase family protein [Candidatus Obscuribacterales bacterium]
MNEISSQIVSRLEDNTGWLTISRPENRNAISSQMWQAIPVAMSSLHADGARVIVIRGTGSCFASGADLAELNAIQTYKDAHLFWNSIKETLSFVHAFEIPTIAMINGPCLGGGCLLATACDLRFASREAILGIPAARLGIVLDDDSVGRLTQLVGPARALEMLFTGNHITAEQAEFIGLVNKCVEPDQLEKLTCEIANAASLNAFASIAEAKRSVKRAVSLNDRSGLLPQHESVVLSSYLTSDFKNRVKALANN